MQGKSRELRCCGLTFFKGLIELKIHFSSPSINHIQVTLISIVKGVLFILLSPLKVGVAVTTYTVQSCSEKEMDGIFTI